MKNTNKEEITETKQNLRKKKKVKKENNIKTKGQEARQDKPKKKT